MDPTKPILDLYSDSTNYNHQKSAYRSTQPPSTSLKYNRPPPPKEISYNQLKEKYQQLYQAYSEKVQKVNEYEEQIENRREQNQKLSQEVQRLEDMNKQINSTLLNKNIELEQVYRQIQGDVKRVNQSKKNDEALERFEEGLREAITSNFGLLRETTLSQLKQF